MNAREQARYDAVKRVGTFGINNAADFTTIRPPATKVTAAQNQAKQLFDDLSTPETGLIDLIAKTAETQQSGSGTARGGTTSKTVLRDALLLELKGINRTAAAIAEDQEKPEIMDKFRMPHGVGDAVLVAKAKAIAEAAAARAADFDRYGHEETFVTDLRAHIEAFNNAETTQDTGQQTRAGATGGFSPLLKQALKKLKQLDAFAHNFYRGDAAKMGEWHAASHIERQAQKKETPAKPAGTP